MYPYSLEVNFITSRCIKTELLNLQGGLDVYEKRLPHNYKITISEFSEYLQISRLLQPSEKCRSITPGLYPAEIPQASNIHNAGLFCFEKTRPFILPSDDVTGCNYELQTAANHPSSVHNRYHLFSARQ